MSLVFGMLICMNEKNKAGFFLLEEDGESLAHQKICSLARLEKSQHFQHSLIVNISLMD